MKCDCERCVKGRMNGDLCDVMMKVMGGVNCDVNVNAISRARSSEVYEETTRGATGDDEG